MKFVVGDVETDTSERSEEEFNDNVDALIGLMECSIVGFYALNSEDGAIEPDEITSAMMTLLTEYLSRIEDDSTKAKLADLVIADLARIAHPITN